MKNPYVFWSVAVLALIAGFFLGKSQWLHDLFVTTKQSPPRPTSEGKPCTTAGGKAGIVKGGVCTDTGGIPVDTISAERANYPTNTSDVNTARKIACTNPVTGQQGTVGANGECVPNSNSSARPSYANVLAGLSQEQQQAYYSIKNDTSRSIPSACQLWVDMVANGASSASIAAQWKVCSAAWGRTQSANPTAPNELLIPVSADCQKFTSANPYKSMGCSYVFQGYVLDKGRRVCKLIKISCP